MLLGSPVGAACAGDGLRGSDREATRGRPYYSASRGSALGKTELEDLDGLHEQRVESLESGVWRWCPQ